MSHKISKCVCYALFCRGYITRAIHVPCTAYPSGLRCGIFLGIYCAWANQVVLMEISFMRSIIFSRTMILKFCRQPNNKVPCKVWKGCHDATYSYKQTTGDVATVKLQRKQYQAIARTNANSLFIGPQKHTSDEFMILQHHPSKLWVKVYK